MGPAELAAEVALVARILARLGLVHAFGHVSSRVAGGGGSPEPGWVLLTPTSPPLGELVTEDVLKLDADGRLLGGAAEHRPLEAPLHLAIYSARPDVGAICRVHGPAVAASAALGSAPPLLHGFGGMVEPVAVWDDPDLVAGWPVAGRVAGVLGDAPALLLAGNGGLAVGADLDQALARAWCLEDRCRVALAAGDRGRPLTGEALERRRRWYGAETARLARWLRQTVGS